MYLSNIICGVLAAINLKKLLHLYQLKDYNNARYLSFFKLRWLIYFCIFGLTIIQFVLGVNLFVNAAIILLIFAPTINLVGAQKTPIKYTARLNHFYYIGIMLIFILCCFKFGVAVIGLSYIFLPIICKALDIFDFIKNKKFIKTAQKKLQTIRPKIIAITGSNGKTSVKNILFEMIKSLNAQVCPKSYNTPLGIAKFINEELKIDCKYLILEYGARHIGDVKKMCKLFGADIGIITCVAPQHIQTFKSTENVYKAKKELSDFLGEKLCVYNLENIYCLRMSALKTGQKIGVGLNNLCEFSAKNIKIKNYCTNFTLTINNCEYNTKTKLLGKHNVINILLACAVAIKLNVKIEDILSAITNLNYTPHRLELIRGRINILDDSYNCSILSARESLWVLKNLPNKKMVCTPGIIEGGKREKEINIKLGALMSGIDYVIIVGKHNLDAILAGLKQINFNKNNIFFARTLNDAKQYFNILKNNDNLLLLNDLPDDYK